MAQSTSHEAPPPAPQQATPHVGSTPGSVGPMGAAPSGIGAGSRPSMTGVQQTPETPPADPVLFEDIDPIYLARLYPQALAGGIGEARELAMAAGVAAHDDGLNLVASQQEPVIELPPVPPAPPPPEPVPTPRREA
jgi:hypothetical protein